MIFCEYIGFSKWTKNDKNPQNRFFINLLDFQINKNEKNKRKKKYAKSNFWWIYWILKIDENRQKSAKLIFYELSDFKNRRKYIKLSTLQEKKEEKNPRKRIFFAVLSSLFQIFGQKLDILHSVSLWRIQQNPWQHLPDQSVFWCCQGCFWQWQVLKDDW